VAQEYVKGLLSSGEVVLVDTRQHWMAAIRYALKPILLVGAVILLGILNSWLNFDGALSFINDLVTYALIIMVVIAVIWLPINLVQWYSRKYVLTNRRAMRMSGVLRKKSFDSSLEQINDIVLVQSVFGRTLGYADLTLYTASDTANESYEQLIDGIQYKKAVLDAKEGIRNGAPLQALPEGFIVKGGTNEASMRADGKLEEAAAQADPASAESAPSDAAEPPSEAQVPAPAAAPPPAPPVASEPAAEPPSAPEPIAEPALVAESEPPAEPVAEPGPAPETATEPEAATLAADADTSSAETNDSKPA